MTGGQSRGAGPGIQQDGENDAVMESEENAPLLQLLAFMRNNFCSDSESSVDDLKMDKRLAEIDVKQLFDESLLTPESIAYIHEAVEFLMEK